MAALAGAALHLTNERLATGAHDHSGPDRGAIGGHVADHAHLEVVPLCRDLVPERHAGEHIAVAVEIDVGDGDAPTVLGGDTGVVGVELEAAIAIAPVEIGWRPSYTAVITRSR